MNETETPSIIVAAKERKALLELQTNSGERLKKLIETTAKKKKLGGRDSAVVLGERVFGQMDDASYCIEIRENTEFDHICALEFSSGEFVRTYVFNSQDLSVWNSYMDTNRKKGAFIGLPAADLRKKPSMSDLTQLNEVMDLFEQNVGEGVNRD